MIKLKGLMSLVLSLMLVASSGLTAFAAEDKAPNLAAEPSTKVVIQYLLDAGYSMDFIEAIDDTVRLKLYEGQYTYESTTKTYGVFTEDYQAEYTLNDDGSIVINDENIRIFEHILEEDSLVEKILADKTMNVGSRTETTVPESEIQKVEAMPVEKAIKALSNWSASITCSHQSYSGGVVRKYLTYTWKWEYSPIWTLTDKVAMAWSGDFTAEPSTIYWTYKKNVGFTGTQIYTDYINESGYGYDDYNPNAGCGVGINIRGTISGTYDRYHTGTLSAQITKTTNTNSRESAIGRYYHKQITPGLSLSFSKSGPSISVSAGSNYDQSSDSAVAFWATSN